MKHLIYLIVAIALLCSSGCKQNVAYANYIQDNLSESYPEWAADFDSIFIVPRLGCNACINMADKIIKSRLSNERNLYIFTNIQSKKLINIEYGKENVERDNVVIDATNKYWKQRFVQSAYPGLLVVKTDGTLDFQYLLDSGLQ